MRLRTNINKLGQIYIPKKEREKIGMEDMVEVDYVADARAILLIPSNFSAEEALKSIEIIKSHLKHEAELESKEVEVTV